MEYDIVIGLETHVELATQTKVFCSCKNQFGGAPNTHCCEVCTGMPGALPTINEKAVEFTVKAGLATHCTIHNEFYFERKNYFYPDLAKAYQISQLVVPICANGYVEIPTSNGTKKVRIHEIHLEEDSGKLIHTPMGSLIDYNRAGVPLVETVTEPNMHSAEEAISYLHTLKSIYKYIGISECKMEQGALRCDVNISLKPKGAKQLGNRTEMKNINSFKAIERAICYEIERQKGLLEQGKPIVQETLRWDDALGQNFPMRSKEDAQDYRYFREPDLLPIKITNKQLSAWKESLPKLPAEKKAEYMQAYALPEYDANLLSQSKTLSTFFDACVQSYHNPKALSNFILNELNKKRNAELVEDEDAPITITPAHFAKLVELYQTGEIAQAGARQLLDVLYETDQDPTPLVETMGLKQQNNADKLESIVQDIINQNPNAVADYQGGNKRALAFFVGQVMKATKGKANAGLVNQIITKLLG